MFKPLLFILLFTLFLITYVTDANAQNDEFGL